jgi:hypothetical protein
MSMQYEIAGLDIDELTAPQLRKLLRRGALSSLMKKQSAERDEDTDRAAEENEKLVDLAEEKKGKSKAPEVREDDLPEGVELAEGKPKKNKKVS